MIAPDFRDRLEALLGPVNTITRAATALGCDRRSIHRWLDPNDPTPVPLWAIRHVETAEELRRSLTAYSRLLQDDEEPDPDFLLELQLLPERWRRSPPP